MRHARHRPAKIPPLPPHPRLLQHLPPHLQVRRRSASPVSRPTRLLRRPAKLISCLRANAERSARAPLRLPPPSRMPRPMQPISNRSQTLPRPIHNKHSNGGAVRPPHLDGFRSRCLHSTSRRSSCRSRLRCRCLPYGLRVCGRFGPRRGTRGMRMWAWLRTIDTNIRELYPGRGLA
jgi:hypothetical protein